MIDRLLSLFRRPMPPLWPEEPAQQPTGLYATGTPAHSQRPASVETARQQMDYADRQFSAWWSWYSDSPDSRLRGPRQPLARNAYAAGAASVYALAQSLGVVIYPPSESPTDENSASHVESQETVERICSCDRQPHRLL